MRALSNSLFLAQNDVSATPYVRVYVNSTEYTTANRVIAALSVEEPFNDRGEILLDNSDQNFKASDLIGYELNLGFGMGNEYSNVPDLYVTHQEDISICGKLFTRLVCTGNWGRLNIHKIMGDSAAAAPSTGEDTVTEIIEGGGAGDAALLSGMTLLDDEESGEAATKAPDLKFEVYTSRAAVIKRAVELTDNLVFMRDGDMRMVQNATGQQHRISGTFTGELTAGETLTGSNSGATCKFVYQSVASGVGYMVVEDVSGTIETAEDLDGASESCDTITAINDEHYLYELDGDHTFWENTRAQSLLKANRVICVDALPTTDGTQHTYINQANDEDDQAVFGISTYIFADPSVTSDAEALTSATNMLKRFQAESSGGVLKAPMNCGQEMYDIVKITDSRAGWDSGSELELRVGGIERKFHAFTGEYTITLTFGGLVQLEPQSIDLGDVIPEEEEIEEITEDKVDEEQKDIYDRTGKWKLRLDVKTAFPPIPEVYNPPMLPAVATVPETVKGFDPFRELKKWTEFGKGLVPRGFGAPSWQPSKGWATQPDWGGSVTAQQRIPAFPGDTGPQPIGTQIPWKKVGIGAGVVAAGALLGGFAGAAAGALGRLVPSAGRLAPVTQTVGGAGGWSGKVEVISRSEQEAQQEESEDWKAGSLF